MRALILTTLCALVVCAADVRADDGSLRISRPQSRTDQSQSKPPSPNTFVPFELPSRAGEPPTRVDELPSRAGELPTRVDELRTHADELPTAVDELRTHADELPTAVDELPAAMDELRTHADELSARAHESRSASTQSCCAPETDQANANSEQNCCSSGREHDSADKGNCCSSDEHQFSSALASPSEHFGMWLKMSVYPALCHTVLCQRQCALNGYESCNALGVQRSILFDSVRSDGGCGASGCQSASPEQ